MTLALPHMLDTIRLGAKPIATTMAWKRTIFIGKGYRVTMKEFIPIHWRGEKYKAYYNCQRNGRMVVGYCMELGKLL